MKLRVALVLCFACGATNSLAWNEQTSFQELWRSSPLLLRMCPATKSINVNAMKLSPDLTFGLGKGVCLAEFSSIEIADDKVAFEGKMTRLRPEGDPLTLRPLGNPEPFKIVVACPRAALSEERIRAVDRQLFLHIALAPDKAVPEHFRRFVEELAGLPVARVEGVTEINPKFPGGDISPRTATRIHRDELPRIRLAPELNIRSEEGIWAFRARW